MPWAAVHDRLPYHHNRTRQAPRTLLPHQGGDVADRWCHYVRIVGVPRSPRALFGVMLAELRLADAVHRVLPVMEEAWVVPADFPMPDLEDVLPSTEEAAALAAYRARKRRHGDMSVAALFSPVPPILGLRQTPRGVPRLGQPPCPRRGRPSTSSAFTGPEGAKGRRAYGIPRVQGRDAAEGPRCPQRPTPTGTVIRRPVMTGPGWHLKDAGPRSGMKAPPARPETTLGTGGRPMRVVAMYAPDRTTETVEKAKSAALPILAITPRGFRPVRKTVAAMLPPSATAPCVAPTAVKAVGATPLVGASEALSPDRTAGSTPPPAPGRPLGRRAAPRTAATWGRSPVGTAGNTPLTASGQAPGVRAPCAGTPVPTKTAQRRGCWSWGFWAPSRPPSRGSRTALKTGGWPSLWEPRAPMTATAWRDSRTSEKIGPVFGHDAAVYRAEVRPRISPPPW